MSDSAASQACPRCGAPMAAATAVCQSCGESLVSSSPTRVTRAPESADHPDHPTQAQPGRTSPSLEGGLDGSPSVKLVQGVEIAQRYRILGLLGRGGMGTVYRALDRELSRDVAVKVLRTEIAQEKSSLERFKREIQLSSQITHRNVLRVYDLGSHETLRFLTMQYVEGEDLASKVRREGRLPIPRVMSLFRQIAMGIEAAHEMGVIHRDLKPQNIMVDRADHVYVTDFGLARLQESSGMTETGALFGTPHYMSPEQVKGSLLDGRSDIYSLGVILYELLTGEIPFSGGTPYEVMSRRLHQDPRPAAAINPEIPNWLRGVIDRCLTRSPSDRYPNVTALLAALDAKSVHTSLALEIRRRRWLKSAILGVGATLLSLAAYWTFGRLQESPRADGRPRSILIADFSNRTGESVFDGTLEPALGVALEGAPFITSYSRAAAKRVAAQLRPGAA
ncbi:MAG TPA: serine/threonine-protein kinase, partial [Vicinamibacteria bacterium]|nr:serine/threonine-protein kinase [Vicinamibacteria bacterium]